MRQLEIAVNRIKNIAFGDSITNVCAGESNPRRHCYFVEHVKKRAKTLGGFPSTEHLVKCTDKKGKFWNTDIKVIFQGHLDIDECNILFEPIHKEIFGK